MPRPRRLTVAVGVVALVEVLLVLTAVQKVLGPRAAAGALRQVGLPVPLGLVRLGAVAELVAGLGALVSGSPVFTAGVALSYTAFAAFVAAARRRPDPVSSCGCFGSGPARSVPPTTGHLVFDLAAAAVAIAATVWSVPGPLVSLGHQPGGGAPLVALVALGSWLSWILLAVAPQTAHAAAPSRPDRAAGR